MYNSNIVDKVYLALELTKIRYNKANIIDDMSILDTYTFFIERLTGIGIDKIDIIPKLQKELEESNIRYNKLTTEFDSKLDEILKITYKEVIKKLDEYKGDMEDYVYKDLKNLLTSKK